MAQSITASDAGGGNAENLNGLIEINAGIQPGDSGGSLVNAHGQVIGMDTAASADSNYQASSQAYAIPIQTALSVAHKIVAGQASSVIHIGPTGFLGLGISYSSGGIRGRPAASPAQWSGAPGRRERWCPRWCRARLPDRPAWWPATRS